MRYGDAVKLFPIILLVVLALAGCAFNPLAPPSPYLRAQDVQALFSNAEEKQLLYVANEQQQVYLYHLSFESGTIFLIDGRQFPEWSGNFVSEMENYANTVNRELDQQIASSIGVRLLYDIYPPGVSIRCQRATDVPEQVECFINYGRGEGWERLPVQ